MTDLPIPKLYSGKVRDIYDLGGDHLLMIASDRMSAFDVVTIGTLQVNGGLRVERYDTEYQALATTGLLAKTALFPLHIWLPPAHAGAPAAASAVLSALVIKGSWFLLIRLWFDALPGAVTFSAAP